MLNSHVINVVLFALLVPAGASAQTSPPPIELSNSTEVAIEDEASVEVSCKPPPMGRTQDEEAEPKPVPPGTCLPLLLPIPQRFEREDRTPSDDLTWYTGRAPYLGPGFRVAPGASLRLTGDPGIAYTMDVFALARIGLHPGDEQWGLIPEAGYTLRTPDSEHVWSVGLGLGWGMGMEYTTFIYMPRLVFDTNGDEMALGMRNGLIWDPAENGFAVELGHQYVKRDGTALHDLQLNVSIDLALLVMAVVEG